MSFIDSPTEGVTAYGTLGLSDHPLAAYPNLRTEIIGAFPTDTPAFANVISTCAFNVINSAAPIAPGVVHYEAVAMYDLSPTLEHIMFVPPFLWDDKPAPLKLPDATLTWLMVVPITAREAAFVDVQGSGALEDIFEREDIDIFDIARPSVI